LSGFQNAKRAMKKILNQSGQSFQLISIGLPAPMCGGTTGIYQDLEQVSLIVTDAAKLEKCIKFLAKPQ